MSYTVRPISDHTWLRPSSKRRASRFSASWRETETLLLREVEHLAGRQLVIEVDIREQDLRLDGTLRSKARAATPAVVVAFESKHGPMLHRCDTYFAQWSDQGPDWQQNVRAIALTLQSLRDVERHGAAETGQQYTGFKALPAGCAMPPSHMTTEAAYEVLCDVVGDGVVVHGHLDDNALIRRARAAAHPDRHHGDRTAWDRVEQAAQVLGVTR
ncbi:molecular chaperone DnaJ [Nocardioides sp. SLBN-35]|uniref:molecular chaperone DnaJ n=1 Tax=Nocardioides sp. SLBN-35 TaxID=2768445 RepID=UPI00114EAC25|nr:molecular chaperone DnaJ [Nocardioides sp. SLBN-35]TQK68259.1 hypothetical protein FBY23_0005 [Nocardioides sp. SLBN-35]